MHCATHGHTAAEIVHERADGDKPFMGMQTTRPGGVIRKTDAAIAKNYLTEPELQSSTASSTSTSSTPSYKPWSGDR